MNYCLFKLKFKTAVHIGSDSGITSLASGEKQIHSDTIFSSLCIEALESGGQEQLDRLHAYVRSGRLNFSDALPYFGDELYIPKPIITIHSNKVSSEGDSAKKLKKLAYIPITGLSDFICYMKGENAGTSYVLPRERDFGVKSLRTMAAIAGNDEANPFLVGTFEFLDGCGLYIIAAYEANEHIALLKKLLTLLSISGIGGKRTAGMGSFELEEDLLDEPGSEAQKILVRMLMLKQASYFMTLNVSLPTDDELEDALTDGYYNILRRGGFVQSQTYSSTPLKKRVMFLLSAGSCLKKCFKGDIYDVSINGLHPIYRMAKPLFMGVEI